MNEHKAKTHIKTHRCEQLLENNKDPYKSTIAIRYGSRSGYPYDKEGNQWWLDELNIDFDYDATWMSPVCRIVYCPLCGEKLKTDFT